MKSFRIVQILLIEDKGGWSKQISLKTGKSSNHSPFITDLRPEIRSVTISSNPQNGYSTINQDMPTESHLKRVVESPKPTPTFRSPALSQTLTDIPPKPSFLNTESMNRRLSKLAKTPPLNFFENKHNKAPMHSKKYLRSRLGRSTIGRRGQIRYRHADLPLKQRRGSNGSNHESDVEGKSRRKNFSSRPGRKLIVIGNYGGKRKEVAEWVGEAALLDREKGKRMYGVCPFTYYTKARFLLKNRPKPKPNYYLKETPMHYIILATEYVPHQGKCGSVISQAFFPDAITMEISVFPFS